MVLDIAKSEKKYLFQLIFFKLSWLFLKDSFLFFHIKSHPGILVINNWSRMRIITTGTPLVSHEIVGGGLRYTKTNENLTFLRLGSLLIPLLLYSKSNVFVP
jgi:hypothetical protein